MVQQAAEDRFRRFIRSGQNEDRYFDRSMIGNIFDIDTNGNHTPRTFGLAHELTAIATDPQSFDAKGNVTQIPGSLRGMTSDILLSWDFDNRLKSATVDSTTTDYGYDALGRRVSKGSVVFVYGGAGQQNCIAEYASTASPTSPDREFVYGDSIDSLVLISDTNDTRRLLATRNQQWSVVALVDLSDGSAVERYTYDVFGARRVLDASGAEIAGSGQYGTSASQYGNPYGYTSRRHDNESGLMYFRARFYDPTTGEFLSRDPLGYVDGMSLYRGYFVPTHLDPYGEMIRTDETFPSNGWDLPVGYKVPAGHTVVRWCGKPVPRTGGIGGHLYIVVQINGSRHGVIRGSKDEKGIAACKLKGPQLTVSEDPYTNAPEVFPHPDYPGSGKNQSPPNKHHCTVLIVPGSREDVLACIFETAKRINECCIPYVAKPEKGLDGSKGCNSNCAVGWIGSACFQGAIVPNGGLTPGGKPPGVRPIVPGATKPAPKCLGNQIRPRPEILERVKDVCESDDKSVGTQK